MKLSFRLFLVFAAAGLGLAAGFGLRANRASVAAHSAGTHSGTSTSAWPPAGSLRSSERRPGVRRHDDSPLATQLERDLANSTGVTRWLHCLEALEKAGPADFPRLYRLMQGNPAAARLVLARWVEIAPRHLFDLITAANGTSGLPIHELANALFNEWPKRDPDAAIAAMNEPTQVRARQWRWMVAYGLIENDVERALRLMADWHADDVGFGPRGIKAVTQWTRRDPQHAAEFVLGLPDSHSFQSAMESIGREWAKLNPSEALNFAAGQPGKLAEELTTHALQGWAERDVNDAADWLSRADDHTRRRLGPTFAEAWAKRDAAGAVAWCEDHLSGSALAQSVAGALQGLANKDVVGAAALVTEMNPSPARTEAAVAVAKKWFPNLASGQRVTAESIDWLARLDVDSRRRVLEGITWSWATSDARSMAGFLAGTGSESIPSHAYIVTARELARRDPTEALQWASRLTGDAALSAGGAAFGEWRSSQPEAALRWLDGLPATDARRQPYLEDAIRQLAYHPQAAEQFTAMNPSQRAAARGVIGTMNLQEDRRARLLELLKP